MKRKLLAVLLAVLMVLSMLPTIVAPKTAVAETVTPHDAIEGGAILHCFNWTYNEIRANLADIAAAGYVAVQTSPVQQGKDYDASYMDSKGQWWKLYQPLGLRVAPDVDGVPTSFLGTKDELEALCEEAEDLGIYVIVDIVVNHLANKTGGGYYVNGEVNLSEQVDEEYQNHPEYFHHNTDGVNDGSRYDMTQNQMGMPDLNTSNEYIQEQVYGLLKECVDCGVDGFRFDAAKHIELPGDPGCGSDFWPAVLNGNDTDGDILGIRPYAGAENLFIYGESLSGNAGESWVDEFTDNYMALTDSNYGGRMRDALNQTNAGMLGDGSYVRCSDPAGNVVWVESHDTYEDGASSGIESDKIVRAWAIVGARANSTALYLARPNEIMGVASTDTAWKSTAVAEINAFKNHYDGTGEYLHQNYDNKVAWIERGADGNAGVSIAKLDGAGAVSLELEWMADGYYEDEITGNVFTVSNGTITGNVGPTGVAVVYNTTSYTPPTPSEYITADPIYFVPTGWWTNDNARFEMWVFNSNGGMFVSLTDADGDGTYEGALPEGNWTGVIFVRMNPNGAEHSWDSKWNQTDDLVPDPGTDCFTITAGSSSGTWSVYGGGTTNPDAGYYLIGSMTGWAIVPEYKMTRTGAETEEYMFETELIRTSSYHSQVKAVYSPDGVTKQTWYPDGFDNNYGDYDGELTVSGVYKIYFRPNYDGGSDWHDNCLYAEQSEYFVTVSDADKNGVVTVNKDTAAPGDTVTVTVTPHEGYELDTLVYRYETEPDTMNFESVAIENGSFTMPAFNVTVIATFKELTAEPEFKTHALALEGKIGVTFFMDLSGLNDDEKAASYMTFAITGASPLPDDPVPFDADNMNGNGTYYGFTCYVTSIQMADTITATFHYGDGQTVSEEYSIKQYIETFEDMESQFDETTVALVHALADYGHYVQAFLADYKGWELSQDGYYISEDGNYAEMDTFYSDSSTYNYRTIANELRYKAINREFKDENIVKAPYTVIFDSDTAIRVFFKPAAGFNGNVSATLDSMNSNETYLERGSDGRYMVEIANIPAHLLGETHVIHVYTGDNCFSTDTDGFTRVDVSAMSYVYGILTSAAYADNHAAKAGVASLYAYWQAAQAYKEAH